MTKKWLMILFIFLVFKSNLIGQTFESKDSLVGIYKLVCACEIKGYNFLLIEANNARKGVFQKKSNKVNRLKVKKNKIYQFDFKITKYIPFLAVGGGYTNYLSINLDKENKVTLNLNKLTIGEIFVVSDENPQYKYSRRTCKKNYFNNP